MIWINTSFIMIWDLQLHLLSPACFPFAARKRGIGNALYFEKNGQRTEDFSDPEAETVIELNGMRSELFLCRK